MDKICLNIPKEAENMQLPDPELLNYYVDLQNRIIWLNEDVDTYTLEIAKYIINWNREDSSIPIDTRKPIKIVFFSYGGELDVHNTLIDIIKLSKTPIWGINAGRCASAAAFIYLSCHKRYMLKRGTFLFHQGSGSFSGTFAEICSQLTDYQASVEEISKFMIKHTKYTAEEVEENITTEWYVRCEEAIEKGVCEEVIDDIEVLF